MSNRGLYRVRDSECSRYRESTEDVFASRVSHQLPSYISWKLDPLSKGRGAFQISWQHLRGHVLPTFSLIGRVLKKVQTDQALILLITPAWQSQSWFPRLLQMSIKNPTLVLQMEDLLLGPKVEKHPGQSQGNFICRRNFKTSYRPYLKCQRTGFGLSLRIGLERVE